MSHPSLHPVRGWRVAAVTGPVVWVLAGVVPIVWGLSLLERVDRFVDVVYLASLTAASVASAVGWLHSRSAVRSR